MPQLYALVEGQTEENFWNIVLAPHLCVCGIAVHSAVLMGKGGGGSTTFGALRRDLCRLAAGKSPGAFVTTMLDLYRAPKEFPGLTYQASARARIQHLERQFLEVVQPDVQHLGPGGFIPYLQLHEFEALLLVDPMQLQEEFPEHE